MTATVFIATSLDGFIARENGAIDWLPHFEHGEDYGYSAFFESIDAIVMGRHSYEMVRTFPGWPYGSKRVVVLTSRSLEIPPSLAATVETMSGSPQQIVDRLAAQGAKHLYVDGGKTIQRFLADGLIHRMIITRIPIVIGTGIPLFGPVPKDIKLKHIGTRSYASGLVQSEYEIE